MKWISRRLLQDCLGLLITFYALLENAGLTESLNVINFNQHSFILYQLSAVLPRLIFSKHFCKTVVPSRVI